MMSFSFEELEANIKQAKDEIELGNALDRLLSNRDFKKVVLNGYFEKEAVNLVHAKAALAFEDNGAHESIVRQIDAIGSFSKYLKGIAETAKLARKSIEADEQTRDELLNEDMNNA
jgi:hypothetical protein